MKPIVLFLVLVLVGMAAIAGGLRLTDHSASATPPASNLSVQERFVRAGNGICAQYYDELMAAFEGRSIPKTAEMKAKWMQREIPLFERAYARLRTLVPPARDARTFRRLLRKMRRADHDSHVTLHAYETGQLGRVAFVEREERRVHLNRRANSLSRRVGLTVCGLNAHQIAARYG